MWSIPSDGGAASQNLFAVTGHNDWISSATFDYSGNRLATGSGDSCVILWDSENGDCLKVFEEHSQPVWSVSWHSGGHHVASASMDNTVSILRVCFGVIYQRWALAQAKALIVL